MSAPAFRVDTWADLATAITVFSSSDELRHRVPLLQALYHGEIGFLEVARRGSGGKLKTFIAGVKHPAIVLLGDDDEASTGPAGWAVAERAFRWARGIILHGSGAQVEHYSDAVTAAKGVGQLVMVECTTTNLDAWFRAAQRWRRRQAGVLVHRVPPAPGRAPCRGASGAAALTALAQRQPRREAKAPCVKRRGFLALLVARPALDTACILDREADILIARGQHAQAERLSHRAASLRGWS